MSDYDADLEFHKDRKRHAVERVDKSVYEYTKLLNLQPESCGECMAKVREVLRQYEQA